MNIHLTKSQIGLDGVPAAETVLSHVDGERGELIIAGEHIADLAGKSSFEGVTARLWSGASGRTLSEADVRKSLGAARERAFARLPDLLPATRGLSIVDGFRAAIAGLRAENGLEHEATIVGAFPVIAGALVQRAKGGEPLAPNPNLGHAADTLAMLRGGKAEPREVAALDAYLVTVCDHGMNASTFATRVVASTQADLFAAVTAGYCALTGPLHGGANQAVIEMLEKIKEDGGDTDKWIAKAKDKNDPFRLMGFGHRVYKNFDPRAKIIKKACDDILEKLGMDDEVLEIAKKLEEVALKDPYFVERKLYPNVDFYSGIIYRALGFPTDMFTVLFALGRLPGWIAQWKEMKENKEPIGRPRQIYAGAVNKDYVEIEKR